MSEYSITYLRDINAARAALGDGPLALDDLIVRISAEDGCGESFSLKDAELYLAKHTGDGSSYTDYASAKDLYRDIGCYLSLRYLSFADKNPYALQFSEDEVFPWIDDVYKGSCSQSNIGRLYGYMIERSAGVPFSDKFPKLIIFAKEETMKGWLRFGMSAPKKVADIPNVADVDPKAIEQGNSAIAEETSSQWLGFVSREKIVDGLKHYSSYPKEVRHEFALKSLDSLERLIVSERREHVQFVPGFGGLVRTIAREERKGGWNRYIDDFKTIYKEQLDVKKVFQNLLPEDPDLSEKLKDFFKFNSRTFMGRVIEYWGRLGYLEPGDSKILMEIVGYLRRGDAAGHLKRLAVLDSDFDISTKCSAIRALGGMAYIDAEEKKDVADYLVSFITHETRQENWYKSDDLRLVFEAIVSLGKLGLSNVDGKDIVQFLARFFYSPLYQKVDHSLGWINLAGLRGLISIYESTDDEKAKNVIYQTILTDGLSHLSEMCRALSYHFLRDH